MNAPDKNSKLRILLAALGGEGGGVLMNWIVTASRNAGYAVQATSVPGVAQRTGSTSYYIEIAESSPDKPPVLGLVPIPGRVDVVLSSELVESARVINAGYVSPKLTTLISSTARTYSTAEKIIIGDGRYTEENVRRAAENLAREYFLLDLGKLAIDNGTFVSTTMFGALAGSGVLPWDVDKSRSVLEGAGNATASQAGFDAAVDAVIALRGASSENEAAAPAANLPVMIGKRDLRHLPEELQEVLSLGFDRCTDFLDIAYGEKYLSRTELLYLPVYLENSGTRHAVTEACRRLALWMSYEDVARVADLKTRPERFDRIRQESGVSPGQFMTVTEYMKPRADEIADILPVSIGTWIMNRLERGGKFPLLGKGIHVRSNGVFGYWMLRGVAVLRRIRRSSFRFNKEQVAIEEWLTMFSQSLSQAPAFAQALAELPRVLKGYSDTLQRGKIAYDRIMTQIVRPASQTGAWDDLAVPLRTAITAALADDTHDQLDAVLSTDQTAASGTEMNSLANPSEATC